MFLQKAIAFVKRDFIIESSYKISFIFELLGSLLPLFSFYFISRLIVGKDIISLHKYGGEYFPFVLIGIALTQYFMLALRTFSTTIRRSQMEGCLEAMLSTKTSPQTVILLSPLYSFIFKLVHIILIFGVGGIFLGVNYNQTNFVSAIVTLIITIFTFSSIGIFSAAVIIVIKKGDPIEWIFGSFLSLISGAYFPIDVLPEWLQKISSMSPLTYALDAMRLAIFKGYNVIILKNQLLILGLMVLILFPLSIWTFSMAIDKGRRDGSLMQY